MSLEEARRKIDHIDPQIRGLLMNRYDAAEEVVQAKLAAGETTIYRPGREEDILRRLGEGIPESRRTEYLSVVRKIMQSSRMYQYGLMYDALEDPFGPIAPEEPIAPDGTRVRLRLTRPNHPNSMTEILAMIGDYGYDMDQMTLVAGGGDEAEVTFELLIVGNLMEIRMKKLMFQISKESTDFQILETY